MVYLQKLKKYSIFRSRNYCRNFVGKDHAVIILEYFCYFKQAKLLFFLYKPKTHFLNTVIFA